ncbi:hypothetical protein [Ferrimonas senticii]|uniref:hypothetical protein n=1 Tax=Ferrimonas senticii TaxID=394566 RepID=UPI0012EC9284|nr:hypothetical protein [Ferrimonas senticii]
MSVKDDESNSMDEHVVGDIIEGAFDAAIDGNWYQWLEQLRRHLGASGGFLVDLGCDYSMPIACGSDVDPGIINSYLSQRQHDPWYWQVHNLPNQVMRLEGLVRQRRAKPRLPNCARRLMPTFIPEWCSRASRATCY